MVVSALTRRRDGTARHQLDDSPRVLWKLESFVDASTRAGPKARIDARGSTKLHEPLRLLHESDPVVTS